MKLKETFNTISKKYDDVRPDYPLLVFKAILKYNPISKTDPLLEIGIGTGKATTFFAKRGNPITAVDPGTNLLNIARKNLSKYNKITYITKSFETAKLPNNHYALVYAGQAFHWIDPVKGLKKVYDILKPGGTLAFFWNMHDSNKPGVGLDTKKLFIKYNLVPENRYTAQGVIKLIKNSPLFTNYKYLETPRIISYSKQHRLKLLQTYSAVISLSPVQKKKFIQETIKSLKKYPSPLRVSVTTKLVMVRKN